MSSLVGHQLKQSDKVQKLIQELVGEVTKINSQITAPREANNDFKEASKQLIESTGKLRGRPLHYSYMGTGSGNGCFVELEDGSVKLDLINGIGIHLMGHSHPRVMAAAVRGAIQDILNQGNLQPNNEYRLMTEKLVQIAGKNSRLKYAWLATCGTMANENALKLSRQKHSPARFIMSFKDAFAGRSTMMAEVTDNPAYKQGLPEYNEVLRVPFYDKKDPRSSEKALNAIKEHVAKHENNISVFGFEPMLGEGGYQAAPREFFVPMLEFCKSKNIAIWMDEVQTFTRTGEYFAFETLGLGQYVDICTIAKTAQIGATLYTEDYNPKPGLIAGTFSGATSSLTAGREMLEMLGEGFLGPQGRINQIHKRFIEGINRINEGSCKGLASDAGGLGLMIAFTPHDGKKDAVNSFLNKLFANGLIAFPCGKDPVRARFLVPAIIKDQEIDLALQLIEKTLLEGV